MSTSRKHPGVVAALAAAVLLAIACGGALAQERGDVPQREASETAQEAPASAAPVADPPEGSLEDELADDAAAATEVPLPALGLDDIRRFVAVFRAVQQAYVDPVDETDLLQAAVRGLLTDLDPHSSYLREDAASALNEQASGAYDGLGLEVLQQPDRTLLVVAPIDDTPAARAGIRPGDVITAIDGVPIGADNVEGAVESMRGEPGTPIALTLVREGAEGPIEVTLVRERITVNSVVIEPLEPGYAYARIAMFQADSGSELERKLRALQGPREPAAGRRGGSKAAAPAAGKLRGLVLDLRSNPGGLLNSAVEIADLFLEQGVIVSTRGRLPAANAVFRAAPGDLLEGAPIVVLTDAGTASAAEVLAGALRDQQRALVMGSVSFGKGSVQTLLPLDNGDAIKITTARYYTPNGTSIQAAGIKPDIVLDADAMLAAGDRPPTLREADLRGHLRNEHDEDAAAGELPVLRPAIVPVPVPAPGAASGDDDGIGSDPAVREALNLLKGLALFGPGQRADAASQLPADRAHTATDEADEGG